ncbi:hypothetical protein HBA55_37030 [Pseudomaricurvus alkylphenolicus]|uniref:hypothetical protein n=1 Tax=Pseudomaricurvus alkylphenolicus TaxID=1306991 RepID=UPI001423CDA4|nr:hypothetical protein [Pseudomaricurvus alkylphenolicus]NIB45235.1 hypothetical protein [Pseudomaricurvus alkylphenolicus]
MNTKLPKYIGIILGVLYGLSIRVLWELDVLRNLGGVVTVSFMFFVPFVIGFIRVHFECKVQPSLTLGKMITVSWQPIFFFLLATVVTLMEGSICVAMALPAFMLCSSLGGVTAGYLYQYFEKRNSTLLSVALFPLLIAPIEVNFIQLSSTYTVENRITIHAPPNVVWQQLGRVAYIKPDEMGISLTSLIGVPQPIKASMNADGIGAVRTSEWEKGVVFKEVITSWEPNGEMTYSFDIDPGIIPDHALDKHVKLGGEYFSPLTGGYFISENPDGNTVLTLKTTLVDNTNFGIYSRIWGELISPCVRIDVTP